MSKTNSFRLSSNASIAEFAPGRIWFFRLILLAFLLACFPAQAQNKEDEYFRIYTLIQQADSLSKNGENGPALTKYQKAKAALRNFQKNYPDWNARVVSFRSNYLAQRVAALSQTAPETAESQPDTKSADAGSTQVKLLEPGAEPRKVLRLHPNAGDKETVTITIKMAIDMKMGEMQNPAMKLPPMKMTMDITVKSVSPEGDIAYEMELTDASVAEGPDVMPQVAQALKTSLAGLKGLTSTGIMSNRGINKTTEMKVPAGADAQARQALDQMKENLAKVLPPLPEEPAGPGAKWEAKMAIKSQGMTIDQTAIYELVSIEEEQVTARITIAQRAANQKMQNPAMPAVKLDLTKMVGNATGELTFDLAKIIAPQATLDNHSELLMNMNNAGQKQTMNMKVDLNVRIEAK